MPGRNTLSTKLITGEIKRFKGAIEPKIGKINKIKNI